MFRVRAARRSRTYHRQLRVFLECLCQHLGEGALTKWDDLGAPVILVAIESTDAFLQCEQRGVDLRALLALLGVVVHRVLVTLGT